MNYCKVCGTEGKVSYRIGKRQTLCDSCNHETPRKVSRESFDKYYWHNDPTVPESTKHEFYDDYLTSSNTLPEYFKSTVFAV